MSGFSARHAAASALRRGPLRLRGGSRNGGSGRTERADQLTGLANRAAMLAHIERALGRSRPVCVMYVDLDDFKLVNDTLGHAAGDELLCHVAAAMQRQAQAGDLVGRQGGDEFVFAAVEPERIDRLAADLRTAITTPVALQGVEVSAGASIGIAVSPTDGNCTADLLERADAAMYEAKRSGRNEIRRWRPAQSRNRDCARASLEFTKELPEAIERDELVLHWQPLVTVCEQSVVGVEALVRWRHPERGLLYPDAFLPFAHRTGLITEVDAWVASALARQRRQWHAQGLDPYVGFNLAPQFARRHDALGSLLGRLTAGGLDLEHVTIELSEGQTLREDPELVKFVRGLHEAGVTISLDDFGRAYSSLNRLRDVPARWVKLHRGFLQQVPEDPIACRVLSAVLDLVRALQFDYIVEGVECERQRVWLDQQGVWIAQGLLLGMPVQAEQLYDRLRASPPSQLTLPAQRAA
ncbi:MAG: EAL domain-containing protein [Solirubrobacteraceae bacterium]|jgi:diguanylate cyclase (GGDEF)-like protein